MKEAIARLKRIRSIGELTAKTLYEKKGINGIEGIFEIGKDGLKEISGIGDKKAKQILESAEELKDKLEKCNICGYYSKTDDPCPYCEDDVVEEESIVDTFISKKNELSQSLGKNNIYDGLVELIEEPLEDEVRHDNIVTTFVDSKKVKKKLDHRFMVIKSKLRELEDRRYVYQSHIQSFEILLTKVKTLEDEGRYRVCFEILTRLDNKLEEMEYASDALSRLDEIKKSLDKSRPSLDFKTRLAYLRKTYSRGDYEKTKELVEKTIEALENELEKKKAKGPIPPSSPKIERGMLNGSKDSGSPSEKGFINGLQNGSLDNTKDKTDMGFINGVKKQRRSLEKKIRWKKTAVTGMIFLLIIGMIAGAFIFFVYEEPDEGVIIDGDFDDWQDIDTVSVERVGLSPSAAIIECAVERSRDRLNYYLKTEEDAFVGGSDRRMDALYVFIQDGKGVEGRSYRTDDLMAQHMIKIQGWQDEIFGRLYRYEDDEKDNNWFGWTHVAGIEIEKEDEKVEFSIPDMYFENDITSQLIVKDHQGREAVIEHLIDPEKPSLTVYQRGLDKDIFHGDGELMELVFRSEGGPVTIENLDFKGNGDGLSVQLEPYMEFPLEIDKGEEREFTVHGEFQGDTGDTISLELVGITSDAVHRIVGSTVHYHLDDIPDDVRIDGAFGDWKDYSRAPEKDVPERIDIRNYGVHTDGEDIYFMLSTRGKILKGTAIPEGVERFVDDRIDSDGDGIPDIYDPYPNDFTNDGVPDSEMVTEEGLPDVDGDGVADWPYGPDRWLNTTIPRDPRIPERYWGREVSRYIGPRPDPVLTGEDKVEVYLGDEGGHGYSIMDHKAEFKIEIKGQYGEVNQFDVKRWSGSENRWVEKDIGTEIAVSLDSMEFLCHGLPDLFDGYEVVFMTSDWDVNHDTAVYSLPINDPGMRLTSLETDQDLFLRDDDLLLTSKGTDESTVTLLNRDGERDHEWTSNDFAGDFHITDDITAHLYLDPRVVGDNRPGLNLTLSTGSGVIGYGERDGLSSEAWYNIPIEVVAPNILGDESLTLSTTITGPEDTESLEVEIDFNSHERDSRLRVPTDTTVDIDWVETYDEEGGYQSTFEGGDTVEVRGNVTHPIDADLVQDVEVTVTCPENSLIVHGEEMPRYENDPQEPPFYSIYNYSFTLDEDPVSGSYQVDVTAWDDQDNSDVGTTFFYVQDDPGVTVYPNDEKEGEPGDSIDFTVNVKNIGNVEDIYKLGSGESSRGWSTYLYHDGTLIAEDVGGDGEWDWVDPSWDSMGDGDPDIELEQNQEKQFVVEKLVPEDTEGLTDETIFEAVSINYDGVYDSCELTTIVPISEEMKTFYLRNEDILNTFLGDEAVENTIEEDESNVWVQDPPMAGEFELIGEAEVHLYIEPHDHGVHIPDVTVSLLEDGENIGSDTINQIETEGWHTFSFSTDHVVSTDSSLELQVSTVNADITVHYDSDGYDSRLNVITDTYVEVLDIETFDSEDESDEFSAGDEVIIESTIGDPIGSYDIAGADVSVYKPDGTALFEDESMGLVEVDPSSPSYWALFDHTFELSQDAQAGDYEIKVEAIESNGVTSFGFGTFSVPGEVDVYPDHNDTADAGTNVSYDHTIENTGAGRDIFHMHVLSSQGFNVSLYSEQGELIAQDIGGDREWEYVNPDWDTTEDGIPDTGWMSSGETLEITLEIEIPPDTGNVTDETVLQVGSYHHDADDEATDVTSIPEFDNWALPASMIFILVLNLFIFRFKGDKRSLKNDL